MQGRTPTSLEKLWMDRVREYGCIVCRTKYGLRSPAEIHHLDGKTKPDAHRKTIGLCDKHHRQGDNRGRWYAVHQNKTRFEVLYGSQITLLVITQIAMREQYGSTFWEKVA